MDLLEYQGKQLFAKHGAARAGGAARRPRSTMRSPPRTRSATRAWSRPRSRSAAAARPAGSRSPRTRPRRGPTAEAILGMDIRGFTVHDLWIEQASEIAAEYYASIILDRSEKKLLAMRLADGRDGRRGGRRDRPRRAGHGATSTRPRGSTTDARPRARGRRRDRRGRHRPGRRDAGQARGGRRRRGRDPARDQPADRHQRPPGGRARLEGDDRRQRPLPPSRARRAHRQVGRGPAGGDGEGEGPHLREARRQHRHPRQRRRALHVDARRRRPGGRQARQLPRRRRRLEGRGDRRRARGDHLGSRT